MLGRSGWLGCLGVTSFFWACPSQIPQCYHSAVGAEVKIPILPSPRAGRATFRQLQLTGVRGAGTLAHFLPNTMPCCTRKRDIISLQDITQSRQLYAAQKHHHCCRNKEETQPQGSVWQDRRFSAASPSRVTAWQLRCHLSQSASGKKDKNKK